MAILLGDSYVWQGKAQAAMSALEPLASANAGNLDFQFVRICFD